MNDDPWIDAEVHLLPPEWCTDKFQPSSSEVVMRRVLYEHPERDAALHLATFESLMTSMDSCGLKGAVLMGMPWKCDQMTWQNNEYIASSVAKGGRYFYGMGLLPAPGVDLVDAVKRIYDMGFRGVKVIPSWHGYVLDASILEPALCEMERLGLVLFPHTDQAYLAPEGHDPAFALLNVARRHPGLKILAPHLGGLLALYSLHPPLKNDMSNILFIASLPTTMRMTLYAVDAVGADRVAFGTDFPFNPSHDQASLCHEFEKLSFNSSVSNGIKGRNLIDFLD